MSHIFIIQQSAKLAVFLTSAIVITVALPSLPKYSSLDTVSSPVDAAALTFQLIETTFNNTPSSNSHHHHHHHDHHTLAKSPFKDTYLVLHSLRKVLGPYGCSPVCKICQTNSVDAKTYDFFCLPNSDGMDGEMCDKLTILGTTSSRHIRHACKNFLARAHLLCKS